MAKVAKKRDFAKLCARAGGASACGNPTVAGQAGAGLPGLRVFTCGPGRRWLSRDVYLRAGPAESVGAFAWDGRAGR